MRDPNRLYSFYNTVAEIHAKHYPDMRFGQFMMNFLGWVNSVKKIDPFFPEEAEMLAYLKEYVGDDDQWFRGSNLL